MKFNRTKGYFLILVIIIALIILTTVLCIKLCQNIGTDERRQNGLVKNDDENDNYSYKNPIVPVGFHKVETDTASWELDEYGNVKGWNEGLVVEDDIGNQFVWIPVEDLLNFEKKEGYFGGKKQEYLENISEADYINLTDESKLLYESIIKYHGFYIARYEAGMLQNSEKYPLDGSIKPVSMPNKAVFYSIPWGSAYGYATDGIQGSDTSNGAVKMARSMYPNLEYLKKYGLPENIENNTGVVSTLCYGVQWDAIMDFISNIDNPYTGTKYIEDSTSMGWFVFNSHDSISLSGIPVDSHSSNCVKNIYDLAGNAWEWTMEICDGKYRVYRGGMYQMADIQPSASMRAKVTPDWVAGFRVALYIK